VTVSSPTSTSGASPHESYADIVSRLAVSASKSNRGAGGYTRWVNRPLGRRAAAFAFLRGFTPNQLTALNSLLIFPTMVLMAVIEPGWLWSSVAALLLMAGYVLDSADGMLARLRGGGSKAGEWLDHVADAVKTAMIHAVIAIVWFRFYDLPDGWLVVPLAFGVVHCTYYFSIMLADDLRRLAKVERREAPPATPPSAEPAPVLRSLIMLPNDWGVLCLLLFTLPVSWLFVAGYTALLAANTLFVLAGWVRWYRELVTL